MKAWRIVLAVIIAWAGLVPLQAAAQNLLLNGSFETGPTNWNLLESGPFAPGNCDPEFDTAGTVTGAFGAWTTPPPTDGAIVYMSDANQPGTCKLYQDVVLPTTNSAYVLTYAAGYNYNPLGPAGPAGCSASVSVTGPGGVVLATGFQIHDSATNVPMGTGSLSFTAPPGSTVRVVLTAVSCNGGPAGIAADNLVLLAGTNTVPALDDWAKIALALLLAATAMFYLRKSAQR